MKTGDWRGARGAHVGSGRVVEIRQLSPLADRSHPLFEVDGDLPEPAACMGARLECLNGAVWIRR
jgi:hypothetical protein